MRYYGTIEKCSKCFAPCYKMVTSARKGGSQDLEVDEDIHVKISDYKNRCILDKGDHADWKPLKGEISFNTGLTKNEANSIIKAFYESANEKPDDVGGSQ